MRVFKYRGGDSMILRRDLRSLAKSQIFSAPIWSFNDPFEAKVKVHDNSFEFGKFLKLLPTFKYNEKIKQAELSFIDALATFIATSKSWGIYSLSKSYNDELLWAYYADSHRGFCVEYDLEKLKEYKIPTEPTVSVEYQNDIPVITSLDVLSMDKNQECLQKKLIATKSKRWAHENEIRIITGQTGLYDYDYRALKCIYFGYRSDERFRKLIMRVLKGREIKYYLMKPKDGSYELEKQKLDDLYPKAPLYLATVAPIEEGVPYIDDTLRPYEDLVRKAIEIVRYEPYCDKVIDAYLSGSKGTKEDPVFYVTYERSDGLPRNYFISKSEIEANGNNAVCV